MWTGQFLYNFISIIKDFIIIFNVYYITLKISGEKFAKEMNKVFEELIKVLFVAIIFIFLKYTTNYLFTIITTIVIEAILIRQNKEENFTTSLMKIIISLGINYILFSVSVFIGYFIETSINIYFFNWTTMVAIITYESLIMILCKLKKLKNGFVFLNNTINNEYIRIIIFNMSIIIISIIAFILTYDSMNFNRMGIIFISISLMMSVTIKKSFDIYYKQKQLIRAFEDTKEKLENKTKEVEELEKENLKFSQTSHTLAHKQRILEHKIDKLLKNDDNKKNADIKAEFDNISKELYKEPEKIIEKTNISEIDDVLECMQSECVENGIDFQVQLNGNIYQMVNNAIPKEKLQILLADHIKDAIIAIQCSDNENKSILVRLGKINNVYSIYIFDSGIEFEKDVLENLGKKPITTHADNGGTGMGFMNTFDTLREYKASLTINELNEPRVDNFTKSIVISFDGKENFEVNSYKKNLIHC